MSLSVYTNCIGVRHIPVVDGSIGRSSSSREQRGSTT
jgi:hypothetical protein